MICPFCFKPLKEEGVFFLANADADAEVEDHSRGNELPHFDYADSEIAGGPLLMHKDCLYLNPILVFPNEAARTRARDLDRTERITAERADQIAALATGTLSEADRGTLELNTGRHWCVTRILASPDPIGSPKRMWFPRRLAGENLEHPLLTIYLSGPEQAGKSFFATMAVSRNTYVYMPGVNLEDNFGYAIPRFVAGTPPYGDFEEILSQLKQTKFSRTQFRATDREAVSFRAGFFRNPFPESDVDTVLLVDLPGERNRGWDAKAHELQRGQPYKCVMIAPSELSCLSGNIRSSGAGRQTASGPKPGIEAACSKISEHRDKFRRVVLIVPKMDQLLFKDGVVRDQRHADLLNRLREHIDQLRKHSSPTFKDSGTRATAPVEVSMEELANQGTKIFRDLLANSVSQQERDLLKVIKQMDAVVFFTGVDGWDVEPGAAADSTKQVCPFGIGEAIRWMAQDRRQRLGGNRFWPDLKEKCGPLLRWLRLSSRL